MPLLVYILRGDEVPQLTVVYMIVWVACLEFHIIVLVYLLPSTCVCRRVLTYMYVCDQNIRNGHSLQMKYYVIVRTLYHLLGKESDHHKGCLWTVE